MAGPLIESQIRDYADKGYVTVPRVLNRTELDVLEAAMDDVTRRDGPEVMRERDGKPHVVYGMHLLDQRFAALSHHPTLVRMVESPGYFHQDVDVGAEPILVERRDPLARIGQLQELLPANAHDALHH